MVLDLTKLGRDWLAGMASALDVEIKWDESDLMRQRRISVQRSFSSVGREPAPNVVRELITAARKGALPDSPKLLRDLMASLHVPFESAEGAEPLTSCLIEDVRFISGAFAAASALEPRWRDRCMGAAMRSYLSYNPYASDATVTGRDGWHTVRRTLHLYGAKSTSDHFGQVLRSHLSIVGDDPTAGYARRMFQGEGDAVRESLRDLGVPENSWFWNELVLGQVRHLATQPKAVFLDRWEGLLDEAELRPSLVDRALVLLLDRYVEVSTVENKRLTDLAFERWRNPLTPQHADAWKARLKPRTFDVVTGWLKLGLIDDFFSLLADDPAADQARTKFWKGQIDDITSIRIFIGDSVRARARHLERRMAGSVRFLRGSTSAFGMVIGDHLFMEFSNTGNALYVYPTNFLEELPAGFLYPRDLKEKRTLRSKRGPQHIANWWPHATGWQTKFVERMRYLR